MPIAPLTRESPSRHPCFARSVILMQGGRQLGMEAQPELYVAAGVAVIAIAAMEAMGKKEAPGKKKRR